MSKYAPLWEHIKSCGSQTIRLTFDEIKDIAGVPIDHSFLTYKKEVKEYWYPGGKISIKDQTVIINRVE